MTPQDKNSDGVANDAAPSTPASFGMRKQVGTPSLTSERRVQGIVIAATSVVATIWLAGAVWAWQVIG